MTAIANVEDRDSVRTAYPHAAYEVDAGNNSSVHALRRGLRIEAGADAEGTFRLSRASYDLSTHANGHGGMFLCPYMGRAYGFFSLTGGARGAVEERRDIFQGDGDEYERFIDEVIDAARSFQHTAQPDPYRLAGHG